MDAYYGVSLDAPGSSGAEIEGAAVSGQPSRVILSADDVNLFLVNITSTQIIDVRFGHYNSSNVRTNLGSIKSGRILIVDRID